MRLFNVWVMGCLGLIAGAAQAENVSGLYQVREPLAGQGTEARAAATSKAFDTLVLRLTGDPKAVQAPALAALRKDPQPIVNQVGSDAGPPEAIRVEFDPGSTERALRKAGLSLWGGNRPSILGWWLNESIDGNSLVGDGQPSAQPLRRAARHRGLPLRLPLADLQEQLVADAKHIDGKDPGPLREVSQRYGADALLAVHAQEADGKWQARWQLWLGDAREQGSVEGADQAALADAVMLAVSTRLAPRYVTRPGANGQVQMQVQDMNLPRYAELARVLESYGAQLKRVEGDVLTYSVTASREQLRAQLALAKLKEVPAEQAPAPQAMPAPVGTAPGEPPMAPATATAPFDGLRFGW
nr:DUF2066 domain-containing protein [uncultured Pseudomonas sp.]